MTRSYSILAVLIGLILAGNLQNTWAQVPARIAYQGLALDQSGGATLADGSYLVTFRLYDEERGGTLAWQERRTLEVNQGLFSVLLGEQAALNLPFDQPYWLSIELDGQTESARMPLSAAPYSLAARSLADSALIAGPGIEIRRTGPQLEVALSPALYSQLQGLGATVAAAADPDAIAGPGGSNAGLDAAYDTGATITVDTADPVRIQTNPGTSTVPLDVRSFGSGAIFRGFGSDGTIAFRIDDDGAFRLHGDQAGNQRTAIMDPNGTDNGGEIDLWDDGVSGALVELEADGAGDGSELRLYFNNAGTREKSVELEADGANDAGAIRLFRSGSTDPTVEVLASEAAAQGGAMYFRDPVGNITVEIDADFSGDGRVITEELQITGGSDLSENFDITGNYDIATAMPGMVVSIDPANAGQLTVSGQPYDRMVAGVVSGAGGIETGLIMAQRGSEADGEFPVALTGRVYVYVDAAYGTVKPGDLLTSSATAGHAMKVTDYGRSQGAILGKAMSGLSEGRGLVLVLVSLQ